MLADLLVLLSFSQISPLVLINIWQLPMILFCFLSICACWWCHLLARCSLTSAHFNILPCSKERMRKADYYCWCHTFIFAVNQSRLSVAHVTLFRPWKCQLPILQICDHLFHSVMFCFVSDWTSGKDLVSPFVAQRLLQSWPTWSREKQRSDKRNFSFWDSPSYSPFQATFLAAVAWRQWFHE